MSKNQPSKQRKRSVPDAVKEAPASAVSIQPQLASEKVSKPTMSDAPSILTFSEDISEQEAPVPLPVGDYPAVIRGAVRKTSKTSGKDYCAVTFFVAPEAYPADYTEGNPDGEVLSYNRVPCDDSPRGRYKIRKFTEAIGAKGGREINLNDWIGLSAILSIGEEEFEGEKRAVIQKVGAA